MHDAASARSGDRDVVQSPRKARRPGRRLWPAVAGLRLRLRPGKRRRRLAATPLSAAQGEAPCPRLKAAWRAPVRFPPQSIGGGRGCPPSSCFDPWESLEDACTKLGLDDLRAPGESAAHFLLRFVVAHPGVDTIIVGTKNLDHLAENVATVQAGPLPADVVAEAKKRLDAAGVTVG